MERTLFEVKTTFHPDPRGDVDTDWTPSVKITRRIHVERYEGHIVFLGEESGRVEEKMKL